MPHELLEMRHVLGITSFSKSKGSDGTFFVNMQLDIKRDDGRLENVNLELTVAQFFTLLAEFEEAKQALKSQAEQ